ncbi:MULTISPECIES: MATE family efflux transporter [unclassified Mycoplasma]
MKHWNKRKNNSQQGQERAVELFEKTPIKKAIWMVAIPGLLTMLMMGLYSFFNQVFILNFVPKTLAMLDGDIANTSGLIYNYLDPSFAANHVTREQFNTIFNTYKQISGANISNLTSDVIASLSVNATIFFVVFCNAVVILVPMGTSVYYTKCISKGVKMTAKDLWATAFWTTSGLAIFAMLVVFIAIWAGLVDKVASRTHLDVTKFSELNEKLSNPNAGAILSQYFDAGHKIAVKWAQQYIYVYAAGTLLQGFYLLLSYLIRAEGKNSYVMIWAIIANIVGLIFDAIFIIVLKWGILGGAAATIVGWTVNVLAYFAYVIVSDKKNDTWIDLKHLFKFRFRYRLIAPISLLGLSAFVRTFGVAVTNLMITLLFNYLPYSDGFVNVYNWAKAAPSITLFFLALFGIADGSSSLLSYNYTKRNVQRVRQTYWYALMIAVIYAVFVYSIVAILAPYFIKILNVPNERLEEVSTFLRINMVRMVFYSFAVGGILLFRATNNIKMAILVVALESFITFWFVMGTFVGIGFGLYNSGHSKETCSYMVSVGFVVNALVVGIIITIFSVHWLYKRLPHIDKQKQTWSLKIENAFFNRAIEYEKTHQYK